MITLVLGGARSGKSAIAERLVVELPPPMTYIATAVITDDDFASRVAAHRDRRPSDWKTIEAGSDLASALDEVAGTVLVDSLGPWVAGGLSSKGAFAVDTAALVDALVRRAGDTVVVSEEVGLGVHPSTAVGRQFRDALGDVNQAVAAVADDVLLVVAGRALSL